SLETRRCCTCGVSHGFRKMRSPQRVLPAFSLVPASCLSRPSFICPLAAVSSSFCKSSLPSLASRSSSSVPLLPPQLPRNAFLACQRHSFSRLSGEAREPVAETRLQATPADPHTGRSYTASTRSWQLWGLRSAPPFSDGKDGSMLGLPGRLSLRLLATSRLRNLAAIDSRETPRTARGVAGLLLRLKWHNSLHASGRPSAELRPHSLLASLAPSEGAPRSAPSARGREEDWEALLKETYLLLPQMKAGEAAEAAYLVATTYESGKGVEDKQEVPIELIKALLVHVLQQDPARNLSPVALHRFLRVSALFPHAAHRGLLEELAATLARRNRHFSVTSLQLLAEDFSSCFLPGFHPLFLSIAEHLVASNRRGGEGACRSSSSRQRTRATETAADGQTEGLADGPDAKANDAEGEEAGGEGENRKLRRGEHPPRFVKEKEDALTATHACFFFNSYSRTNCRPPQFFQLLSDSIEEHLEALHRMQFACGESAPDRLSFSILALGLKGMASCDFQPSGDFVRVAGDLVVAYVTSPEASVLHQPGEKVDTKSLLRALTFFCKARPLSLSSSSPLSSSPPLSSSRHATLGPSSGFPVSSSTSTLSAVPPSDASPADSPVFQIAAFLTEKLPLDAFCADDLADLSGAVRCIDTFLLSVVSPQSLDLLLRQLGEGVQGSQSLPDGLDVIPASPTAREIRHPPPSPSPLPSASPSRSSSPAVLSEVPAPLCIWLRLYKRLQDRFLSLLKLHLSNLHPFQRISILDQMLSTSAFFPPESKRPPKHPSLLLSLKSISQLPRRAAQPRETEPAAPQTPAPPDRRQQSKGDASSSQESVPPHSSSCQAPPALSPALVSLLRSIYYRLASLNLRLLSLLMASLHGLHFSHQGPYAPSRTQQLCAPHKKDVHWANAFLHIIGREGMRKAGSATPEEMAEFLLRYYVDLESFDVCIEPLTFYLEKMAMLHNARPLPPCVLDALTVTLQAASRTPQGPAALQALPERAYAFVETLTRRQCVGL
ncbi:hypothetical protein TGDOM2_291350, partial [Toxoplasma gondii GAB2-2007-GAL-DOM2]